MRGQGMPSLRNGRRGNLRVVVNVVVPRRLSSEQRELFERLHDTLDRGEPPHRGIDALQAAPRAAPPGGVMACAAPQRGRVMLRALRPRDRDPPRGPRTPRGRGAGASGAIGARALGRGGDGGGGGPYRVRGLWQPRRAPGAAGPARGGGGCAGGDRHQRAARRLVGALEALSSAGADRGARRVATHPLRARFRLHRAARRGSRRATVGTYRRS